MKLLLDANLAPRLARLIQDDFPGSAHVHAVGVAGLDDEEIWRRAIERDFAIVSKDSDFYHLSMLRGAPPKVVWLRAGNASTAKIAALLSASAATIRAFGKDQSATFLIIA